mgnify:CR=1 FL=1
MLSPARTTSQAAPVSSLDAADSVRGGSFNDCAAWKADTHIGSP